MKLKLIGATRLVKSLDKLLKLWRLQDSKWEQYESGQQCTSVLPKNFQKYALILLSLF